MKSAGSGMSLDRRVVVLDEERGVSTSLHRRWLSSMKSAVRNVGWDVRGVTTHKFSFYLASAQ